MDEEVSIILDWIGFADNVMATVADEAGLLNIRSFANLDKSGVDALTESLRKRTPAGSRVHVSKGKQDMLLNTADWVADFMRVSLEPEIPVDDAGNEDQAAFEEALELAKSRAEARKHRKENYKSLCEAAEPKKLKEEKDWYEFVDQFYIYLSAIPGVKGIPLAYIIREQAEPAYDREWDPDEFDDQMIACAPLSGAAFKTDAQSVHLMIWTFIESEELLSIIKSMKRSKNGREDFITLRGYMKGAGNVSRRIGTAKQLKQTLHYRNERAMKFTVFMTKLRHMHRIYEDEARPMSAAEKLEDLLEKIKAPFLLHQKANLESRYQMGEVNFEQASSILASAVSNSSEAKISSRISELNREDKEKTGKLRRNRNGEIDVDYSYPAQEYKRLKTDDKNALRIAREKAGKTGGGKKRGGKKNNQAQISELVQVVKSLKQSVDSQSNTSGDTDQPADDDSDSPQSGHAGRQFGGRNEKRQKKDKN